MLAGSKLHLRDQHWLHSTNSVGDNMSATLTEVISAACRSSEDQEVLFDQILMGQLEFPLPYWDNVSETAKVMNTLIFFTDFTARSVKLISFCVFLLKELIRSMLEVEVDQRYTALQVLEHPWVTVSAG